MHALRLLSLIPGQVSVGLLGCCLTLFVSPVLFAQLPVVELRAISPSVAQAGTTINLKLSAGQHLDEARALICAAEGVDATPVLGPTRLLGEKAAPNGEFKVALDSTCSPGLVDVQVLGRFGVSNPRALLITQNPVNVLAADHAHQSAAVAIEPATIVAAQCQPLQRNYYSLTMKAGDTLRAVCYAKRLDSQAIPQMLLIDPEGHELARGRAIGDWPAEIQHTVEREGEYLLTIGDFLHQGGSEHAYALEVAWAAEPVSVEALELNKLLRPCLSIETERVAGEEFLLHARGTLDADSIAATHDLELRKADRLWAEVFSARCDQLTDPRLMIYRLSTVSAESPVQSLSQLVEQDDPPPVGDEVRIATQDPQLLWNVPEDGHYRFVVSDNESGHRPADATAYALIVRSAHPQFQLYAYIPYPANDRNAARPRGSNLLRGGTDAVKFLLVRQDGFVDPVEITAEELPAGVSASSLIIPAGATSGSITLTCTEDSPAWNGALRFRGRSLVTEAMVVDAKAMSVTWPRTPRHNAIQSRLCDQLWFYINDQDTAPLRTQLGNDGVLEVAQGAKLALPIKLTRQTGGQAACLLRSQDLPPKCSLADVTIAAEQSEGTAELVVAADTPPGQYTFWLQNETKVKWRDNPQSVERERAYLTLLQQHLAGISEVGLRAPIEAAIQSATARIEELTKANAEKELVVWLPSTTVRVRIVAKP